MRRKTLEARLDRLEAAIPTPNPGGLPDAVTLATARKMLPAGSASAVHALAERMLHPETLSDAELTAMIENLAAKYGLSDEDLERLAVAGG